MSPASASSLSSSRSVQRSPRSPFSAKWRALPARGGRVVLVAEPAAAAFGDERALHRLAHIGEEPLGTDRAFGIDRRAVDERPDRHGDDQIVAGLARLVVLRTGVTGIGAENFLEAEIDERSDVGGRFEKHVAAAAAVAAGRTAFGHVFLTPPRVVAVAAVAGFVRDRCFVDKLHLVLERSENQKERRAALFRRACEGASVLAGRDNVDMLAIPRGREADLTFHDCGRSCGPCPS